MVGSESAEGKGKSGEVREERRGAEAEGSRLEERIARITGKPVSLTPIASSPPLQVLRERGGKGREGGREAGREGGREAGRQGGREGGWQRGWGGGGQDGWEAERR